MPVVDGQLKEAKSNAIRQSQNELLYQGVKFSAFGSLIASAVVIFTFGTYASTVSSSVWFFGIALVYVLRLYDATCYAKATDKAENAAGWALRFNIGALASSVAWSSTLCLLFPENQLAFQVLMVMMLGGVAGGALASLPYDRAINLQFQLVILASVIIKFLLLGDEFSLYVALFSVFVFGFLISCGNAVSKNYLELLKLKLDIQERSRSVMQTTERMAQIGYWERIEDSPYIELSDNLANIWEESGRTMSIKECFHRVHTDDRRRVRSSFSSVFNNSSEVVVEFRMRRAASSDTYRTMRQVISLDTDLEGREKLLGTVQDITDIRTAEEKIYSMAYFDALTGLANRAYFHERLSVVVDEARALNRQFSLVYIDLDNFKTVNDSFGHECGDSYLKQFSAHLQRMTRHTDMVARLGGDEFCIIVNDVEGETEPVNVAQRCLDFCQSTLEVGNHKLLPRLSVGIASYPADGQTPDELIKSADLAMYHVKNSGKLNYALYTDQMAVDLRDRVRLESDLKQALHNEEFELWYQPQVNVISNCYSGVEALIRWRHPTRGLVSPDAFIATAERVGMIKEIGEWVLLTACRQLAAWNRLGIDTQMAVNISGDHFASQGFLAFVSTVLAETGIDPQALEIEITESLTRDPDMHTLICKKLQHLGVRIAIDDFGTGYSSLSLLGRLPVDTLKIDRTFIMGLPEDHSSRLMVKSIADICLGFHYDVVAEGVETADQLEFLQQLKIPHVQGYYFSKPVPSNEALVVLRKQNPCSRVA